MVDRVRAGRVREGALVQIDDGEGEGGSVGGGKGRSEISVDDGELVQARGNSVLQRSWWGTEPRSGY